MSCALLFRAPTTTPEENEKIYNKTYTEGFTTDMPDAGELQALLEKGFRGTPRDYTR